MIDSRPEVANGQLDRFFIDGDIINYRNGDEVIEDICTFRLSPRAAMNYGFLKVNTDRVIYDTEEFAQGYCKLSGISLEFYKRYRVTLPCSYGGAT